MNFKIIVATVCFFCFHFNAFSQEDLKSLAQERTALMEAYQATPKRSIERKIEKIEEAIVLHIQKEGYLAKVNMEFDFSEVDVKDQKFLGKTLVTLKKGDDIKILERLESGHFKVQTSDNQIGYLYHQNFEPSTKAFPFDVLIAQARKKAADRNFENPNIPPHTRTYSIVPNNGCSKVQCSGITSNGARCRNQTTACDGRCGVH